jgi:hypothetical protein
MTKKKNDTEESFTFGIEGYQTFDLRDASDKRFLQRIMKQEKLETEVEGIDFINKMVKEELIKKIEGATTDKEKDKLKALIGMKEGGVPKEFKGFSKLPESVQVKMDPSLAEKYEKGGIVKKKTGIKRRIAIKGFGVAKRGF